jgi:tetratricopeptide (TPR) repeat protein
MRGRSLVASVTLLSFTTLILWPHGAWAQGDGKAATPPPSEPAAAAPAPAPAGGEDAAMAQAKQHFETGRNAYNAGDYMTAIREFKAAEQLRPSPILDYNIGLANEKLGKRRVAVKYYKRYIELQPNAANKAEVEGKITQLEADIAASPPPVAQPGGAQPGAQTETAADMPPADPNAQPGAAAAQPGYDPYASTAPPGQPVAAKPAKKKSYWWIGLIIGGAVTITIVLAVVIWLYAVDTSTTYYANHGLTSQTAGSGPNGIDRHDLGGVTLLRF